MESGTRVQRIPLEEYLGELRQSAQALNCGYTHQALGDELNYQNYLKEKVDLVQNSPASNNLAIDSELQDISKTIDVNQECLHYLGGITSLEAFYSDITTFNTRRALDLVSQRMGARFWKRKLSDKVKKAWQNLGRYSELVTLHLKHAADFHQLYYDARQIEIQLNERCQKFIRSKKRYNWDRCIGSVVEARELANQLKVDYEHMNYLAAKAEEILHRSATIVPIHLRHARLKHPVKGIMLCDYETPMFKLYAGDELIVYTSPNALGDSDQDVVRSETNDPTTTSDSIHDEVSDEARQRSPERLQTRMVNAPARPFRWEKEESTTATVDSNGGASLCYLADPLHKKGMLDRQYWFVRTPDSRIEGSVPAVCVLIPGPDTDARQRATALNRVLLAAWKDIIDERLAVCLEFFRRFLRQLCESEHIITANDEEFKQLLHELIYSLSLPPTAEGETANREFLNLIEETQAHWEETRRANRSESSSGVYLRQTDIAAFHSVLVWMKINMKTNREYEEKTHSPADIKQTMDQFGVDSFRLTEAIELLNETVKKDRRKVEELLQQLRAWNKQASKEFPDVVSPSLRDSEELFTSSGSEVSDSEISDQGSGDTHLASSPTYSEVIVRSDRYEFYAKQRYSHQGTFLPAIFTYDEQSYTSSVCSDEYSIPYTDEEPSESESIHYAEMGNGQEKEDFIDEEVKLVRDTYLTDSQRPLKFVSATNLDMNVTIERELDTQNSRYKRFRSKRQLDTPMTEAKYSVVYIEVTRDQTKGMVTSPPEASGHNKEIQTEQRVTDKKLKLKEVTEVEEEDQTVIKKKQVKTIMSAKKTLKNVSTQMAPSRADEGTQVEVISEVEFRRNLDEACAKISRRDSLDTDSQKRAKSDRRKRPASWTPLDLHEKEMEKMDKKGTKPTKVRLEEATPTKHNAEYVDKIAIYMKTERKVKGRSGESMEQQEKEKEDDEYGIIDSKQAEKRTKENHTTTHIEIPTLEIGIQAELKQRQKKKEASVSGAMIDAWCSVSSSDWVDSQLSVRPAVMPTMECGVQTDAVVHPEHVSAMVDRSSVSVSTLVGVYGSESAWTQTTETVETEVDSTRVSVPTRVDVTQYTKSEVSSKGACVQASLLTAPLVEAAQHVLMEMASGVSQTPMLDATRVSDEEGVRMVDVCTSYALGHVAVSAEKSHVLHADKRLWSSPTLIEACTTNAEFGVAEMPSLSVVGASETRPGHCSTCGQRLLMETERGEIATDVDRRKAECMDVGVGADYAAVEPLERGTGVVSIRRADGTMHTRPVLAYYVTDEGHMVGVRAEGLEEPGVEVDPTMRRIPLVLEEDRKPELAVSGAMIDAWCSVSSSDWVDSQLSVRPAVMPTMECGVQTDAVVHPEHVSAMVDRSSASVGTLVGVYGSESAWTQTTETVETEVDSTRVSVPTRVDVTQYTKSEVSSKGACVQASLLAAPLVEAAQHVLMEMASGVSQTPMLDATRVSDEDGVRMVDVCTSYALGHVAVSAEKSHVLHADKRLWSSPTLIEACTTNAEFGVAEMPSLSVVGASETRPGHCSTCGQRLLMETELGDFAMDVFHRYPSPLDVVFLGDSFSLRSVPVSVDSFSFFVPSFSVDAACDTSFLLVWRHFGSQFSFTCNSVDVCVLAVPSSSDFSCQFDCSSDSTAAFSVGDHSRVILEDRFVCNVSERLVEHFYFGSPAGPGSSVNFGCQVSPGSFSSLFSSFGRRSKFFDIRSEYFELFNYDAYLCSLSHGFVSETSCSTSELVLPSQKIFSDCYTQTDQYGSRSFLCGLETSALSETETLHSTDYLLYSSRQNQGYVRELGCMTDLDTKAVADIGVQIESSSHESLHLPSSAICRTVTPTVDLDAYEFYIQRNTLGQVRDKQVSCAPPVDSALAQTESVLGLLGGPFVNIELYRRRLLRDEISECGIQCDADACPEAFKDFSAHFESKQTEEHYLEITKTRRKRVVNEVTEERSTEPEHIVCDADVQTELELSHIISSRRSEGSILSARSYEVQTEPIRLTHMRSSSDLSWADRQLRTVIFYGINMVRTRTTGWSSDIASDLTAPILSDNAFLILQPTTKTKNNVSCQTILDDHDARGIGLHHWGDTFGMRLYHPRGPSNDMELDNEEYRAMRDERVPVLPVMIVQLRQRTCQYELLRTNMPQPEGEWNDIREVQSPTTNFFAPIGLAIRRGWVRLGDRNEYVDPSTGDAIPLETAYRMGRIRLARDRSDITSTMDPSTAVTLLIERIYFSWRKTKLVSVIDTARGDVLCPGTAICEGILEVSGNEIRFLDTMANTWLTIEEAVGRQMIQVVAMDSSSDSSSSEEEEPATCRVFRVTHICPGGEDNLWMTTSEATRLGLFNSETGDVAVDWPGRPSIHLMDTTGIQQTMVTAPTRWCSFLTAKHSGWLRLVRERDPQRWIETDSVQQAEPNSVLLSRLINLVAYSNAFESDDYSESSNQSSTTSQRSRSEERYSTAVPTEETTTRMQYSTSLSTSLLDKSTSRFPVHSTQHSDAECITYSFRRRRIGRRPFDFSECPPEQHMRSSTPGSSEGYS